MQHIVDVLIEERAERLMQNPRLWYWVKKMFYPILGYDGTITLTDHVKNMSGHEVFEYLSARLQLNVLTRGLELLPRTGSAIVTPNHPAGIADGIAMFDALKNIRTDIVFLANRDAIRIAPALEEIIIPVEWMEHKRGHERNKETIKSLVKAFRAEKLVVIFPSGRLAQPTINGLRERPWMQSAVNLAQKYECPIVPCHIRARNSWLFYFLYLVNTELRDMTLFRELLNKRGHRYNLIFAEPFSASGNPRAITDQLRQFVVKSLAHGEQTFRSPDLDG